MPCFWFVLLFSNRFIRYTQLTAETIAQLFSEQIPKFIPEGVNNMNTNLPQRFENQLNGKTANENYIEEKKARSLIEYDIKPNIEKQIKGIIEELLKGL